MLPAAPAWAAGCAAVPRARLAFARRGNPGAMIFPRKLLLLVYVAIGVAVAASKDYLENLDTVKRLASAVLAIMLWPLLLVGIDLHIK